MDRQQSVRWARGAAHPDHTRAGKVARRGRVARMTAKVTATEAITGYQQRPAATRNARTIRANLAYTRPLKQTVEDQRQTGAASVSVLVSFAEVQGRPGRTAPDHNSRSQTTLTCRERTSTDLESVLGHDGRGEDRPRPETVSLALSVCHAQCAPKSSAAAHHPLGRAGRASPSAATRRGLCWSAVSGPTEGSSVQRWARSR